MHVSETGTPGLPQDSLSKAIEAASKVNALLIASGKLKPSQAVSENNHRVVSNPAAKKVTQFNVISLISTYINAFVCMNNMKLGLGA